MGFPSKMRHKANAVPDKFSLLLLTLRTSTQFLNSVYKYLYDYTEPTAPNLSSSSFYNLKANSALKTD